MADLFSTNVLTGVVNSLSSDPVNFLTNTFFPGVQTEQSEEIHFDVEDDTMGLAPFVSPVVEGKIMSEKGFTTKTFKPAYIKPKRVFDSSGALKRWKGEPISGSLSPEQRMLAKINEHLQIDRRSIDRRLEWMASQILQAGSVTISGDQYPTTAVSFSRDAALTITLTGGDKWDQSGVDPLDNLQTWNDTMIQKSGSPILNVVMGISAWKVFRNHASVKSRLDLQRAMTQAPSMTQDAIRQRGGVFRGTVDGFNIWTYSEYYKADNGTVTAMLPAAGVILGGDLMGVKAYGAILDESAGYQALPVYTKSWIEQDPPRRFIMSQSAPLLVPYRVNASGYATVV